MVSDDEKSVRATRASTDNNLLRPTNRQQQPQQDGNNNTSSSPFAGGDFADDTGGRRGRRNISDATGGLLPPSSASSGGGGGEAEGKGSKQQQQQQPGWGKKGKSARGLFFRSTAAAAPKSQQHEGDSLPVPALADGSSRKPPKSERTASGSSLSMASTRRARGGVGEGAAADVEDVFATNGSSSSSGSGRQTNLLPSKSWAGNFIRSNSFMRSNSLPMSSGTDGRPWWENSSSGSGVVEEEMEPEPYPPNLERGVKVRKRSMAGKSEIRRLYVRGDTIELVNPEKRMFRSQSKVFPLSELTAVVAQGERSLSLSLGAKGLHLTLADRATKEYLWEHLRKMREQAREQAKASRITRAASIDMIGSASQDFKSKKKVGLFKRSQSYNDASRMARGRSYNEDDDYDDDGDEDFLADLPPGDGRGGGLRAGGGRLAARGRKFLMRISTRSGSTSGNKRSRRDASDVGEDGGSGLGGGGLGMPGSPSPSGRRERGGSDEWSSGESLEDDDDDDDDSEDGDDDDSEDGEDEDSEEDGELTEEDGEEDDESDIDDDDDVSEDNSDGGGGGGSKAEDHRHAPQDGLRQQPRKEAMAAGEEGGGEETSPETTVRPSSAPPPYPLAPSAAADGTPPSYSATAAAAAAAAAAASSSSSSSPTPETEVAIVETSSRSVSFTPGDAHSGATSGARAGAGGKPTSTLVGKDVLSTLRPVGVPAPALVAGAASGGQSRSVTMVEPAKGGVEMNGGEFGGSGGGGVGGGEGADGMDVGGGAATAAALEARSMKKAATLPAMPRVSLLLPSNRPKGGRKSVQFQVPENEGLDSDTTDSPLPEFLSNPDVRFEVTPGDRAALRAALEQLRDALKRATISSESSFTISRSAPGLMPTANAVALSGMRMSRMSASSPSGGTVSGGVVTGGGGGGGGGAVIGGGADGGAGTGGGDQGRLGKQYGSGLPSLLACLKGLKRAGTRLSERHFFCYVGGFTELVSAAEKAWVAISKRSPPDVAAVDRVKAAIIEGTHLAEDHGGGTGDVPHSGARLVVRMVRGLLESDGERLKELSKRIATAARAPIVVGDVFQDEAAGELQLRYMASLDGAPLDKAARTHEKLRTLSELLAPFSCPETQEPVSQLTIEDTSALLWRAHDMLYARMDANVGRRGVFKSSVVPLLPPRRDLAPPPVLCPELPPHHLPRTAMQERVAAGLLGRVSPWDPPMVITGPPGAGKTVLSSAVARRSDVRRHFRDGIFWLPAGKDATERLPWLLEYLAVQLSLVLSSGQAGESKANRMAALTGRGAKQDDEVEVELPWGTRGPREGEVAAFLAAHLATRGLTCLLVVDDLWDRESLDQVRDLGFHVMVTANSKGLLWTQQGAGLAATLGSEVVAVDRMDDDECKLLLQRCSMIETVDWAALRDTEPVKSIIKLCRYGPHALVMVGTTLQGQGRSFSWDATRDSLARTVDSSRSLLQNGASQDPDYVSLYSAGKVCTLKLPDHIRNRYLHLAILPKHVPAPEQMLESLWDTESDEVFDEVLEKLRSHALLQPVVILGDQGRSGHVTSNTQMDYILHTAAGETVEHAAARMSLYLGRLKVLKSGLGRKAGGKYLAMGRCGLVSCWAEVEKRFGFTALEAYTDSIRAYREKAVASGQGSSLKLAAAVKLLADYLFLTNEKTSAMEYYKEALARVEARTEHDRAKPQTQSFSAQVLKGISRCLVAEGQLEEAEERFQKAMSMENTRNPGASRAMLEYCQILRQMGEFDRASAIGGQALALVQTGPTGPHSAESAVCVASLAGLAAQQGKPTLSEELYRRSLGVALRVFGSRHPAVAAETNVLAVFLVEHGRNREAEACYRNSMEIWERTLGPYSPELASGLNNLAILLFVEDRPGEAAATFQRSLDIRQRVLPPNSLETAQGLNNLALLYTSQGQDSTAAERLHREALAIREARLGRNHPEVAQTCHNLALLLLKTGPTTTHSPVGGGKPSSKTSADDKWQWEKVKASKAPPSSETGLSSSLFKGLRLGGGGGNGAQQANGTGPGGAGGGGESYRWRHTEAIKLLERALAVHRETLGDDHPVTEESLQALAAAGGSSTPVTPSPSSRPSSISREVGLAVAAAAAGGGQPSPAATTGSRPTSVDPPPPSLECLNSSDHARETAREQQRQQQREHEQRVKWEQDQAQKLARDHELNKQRLREEKRLKQERELVRQQNLEKQALAREEAELKAKADKLLEDKGQALFVQQQQRQLQNEQRERQRIGSVESGSGDQLVPGGIRGASASVSTAQAAAASAASLERFYSADGAGIDAAAVAAASSSRAAVAGTAAPLLRARSAQGLGAASAGRRDEDDAVTRSFSYQAGADGAPEDGGADSPEGCRLA